MGVAIVKIRVMPVSPEISLEEIEAEARKRIEEAKKNFEREGGEIKSEKQSIAFGLNALLLTFTWDEEASIDELNEKLREIENVSSVEVVDMRRAIG